MNSLSRAAAGLEWAKMNLTLCARGYQNALRMTQCTMARKQSEHKHNRSMKRLPPAQACSQHRRCHSIQPELGPGYKGLATRVLIHNASVNTFISLELHQGLEAEKTVTPNQNLAQCLHLWLFKSQHIPRTVNSSVLCSERSTPQKQKWNEKRGSSATKTPKLQTGLEMVQASMTQSFCKDPQSTDLEDTIGTIQKATITSFC